MGLWAVARRTTGLTKADLDAAFARGAFLRTHVLRPTWHFIDPSDIHWLLDVTAPRIRQMMSSSNNTIGLTTEKLDRSAEVIVDALTGGTPLTRAELGVALTEAGVDPAGHLIHMAMNAEIEKLIVNGPMRSKQHTYVLLDSVVAAPPSQPRDELLALTARRYARGHGQIRDKDLAWWTSLTLTESRRALELSELRPTDIGGETYWSDDEPVDAPHPAAMLLPNFDEYISYARDADDYALFDGTVDEMMRGSGVLVVEGQLAGMWTRTIKSASVAINVRCSPSVTPAIKRALESEAAAYGRFLGREPELQIGA